MINNIHIGNIIRRKLIENNISITEFAKMLCCDRRNVYDIFERKSIDTDLLFRISLIVHEDLFEIYFDAYNSVS